MRTLFLSILPLLLTLGGCTGDALLRKETQRFTEAAGKASTQGEAFYNDLVTLDRSNWALMLAVDKSCMPRSLGVPVYRADPVAPKDAGNTAKRLCSPNPTAIDPLGIAELDRAFFAVEFALLESIASYTAALAELAGDPKLEATAAFSQAKADFDVLLALTGATSPLGDAQTKAITDLIGFVDELAAENGRAQAIRKILEARSAAASKNLLALAAALKRDEPHRAAAKELDRALAALAIKLGPDDASLRIELLRHYYASVDAIERNNQIVATSTKRCTAAKDDPELSADQNALVRTYCGYPAAGITLAASFAHDALVNLAKGDLNVRQRAEKARLAYRQFMRIAKLFVSFAAF